VISWVRSIGECVTDQVEGNGNQRYDNSWEYKQVRIIKEVAACVSQQNTQRRCVDVKAQTEVRQSVLYTDGTWDGHCQSQDDNADQLRQNVLNKDSMDWSTQCSGCKVELTVTIHQYQVTYVSCHYQPAKADQRYCHDGEALTDQQCDQGHVKNGRNV